MTSREAGVVPDRSAEADGPSVLSLVTTPQANGYADQVEALSELGVETTVLPADTGEAADPSDAQSVTDHLRLAAEVARRPLEEYDLIHATSGLTGPAALAQTDLPVVLSLWGSDLLGRYAPVGRLAARRADAVIVPSERTDEELGLDCTVVPHGVDLERFRPQPRQEARAAVGWSRSTKHVFFPYPSAREERNYALATEATDAAEEELDAPVALHATDRAIPHGEMAVHLSAADAMVLPSERPAPPGTVVEAMACNLPVVAMNDGDVAERLEGVHPSAVCRSETEFVDALASVLRRELRSNGRERAREVSSERTALEVLEVYRDVLDEN